MKNNVLVVTVGLTILTSGSVKNVETRDVLKLSTTITHVQTRMNRGRKEVTMNTKEQDLIQMVEDTMMLNWYQQQIETFITTEGQTRLLENTLGLSGEAGEFSEKVKKLVRGDGNWDQQAAAKELGDVLFYLAALATVLNYDLSQIAQMNLDKLTDRKNRDKIKGEGDER